MVTNYVAKNNMELPTASTVAPFVIMQKITTDQNLTAKYSLYRKKWPQKH